MKVKVCGLKYEENITAVVGESPDYIGFIFLKDSPRYVNNLDPQFVRSIENVHKVGVFVNASTSEILKAAKEYELDSVQLHGDEKLDQVKELCAEGISIIKVFRVLNKLPDNLNEFAAFSNLFLFDTQSSYYGGSGQTFDWNILKAVKHQFMIGGGVGIEEITEIKQLDLPMLHGVDLNSKLEVSPGVKDIQQVKKIKTVL